MDYSSEDEGTKVPNGQAKKGTRGMPWHQEPMKDVEICDKPRGADKQALIRGSPNGETPPLVRVVTRV